MDTRDRLVIVRADALDDVIQLAERVAAQHDTVQGNDPITHALRGAIAEVRTHSMLDPVS